jgi:hypothetical protein
MRTLKTKLVDGTLHPNRHEARRTIGLFIEQVHNSQRLHSDWARATLRATGDIAPPAPITASTGDPNLTQEVHRHIHGDSNPVRILAVSPAGCTAYIAKAIPAILASDPPIGEAACRHCMPRVGEFLGTMRQETRSNVNALPSSKNVSATTTLLKSMGGLGGHGLTVAAAFVIVR